MVYYARNRKRNLTSQPKSGSKDTTLDPEKNVAEELPNQEEIPDIHPMIIPKNFQIQNNQ